MSKINKVSALSGTIEDRIKAAQGESAYVAQEDERHLFHVKMDKPSFDPLSGKRRGSKPFMQKFTVADWNNHKLHGSTLGYKTEVMWNPEAYTGVKTEIPTSTDDNEPA